MSVYFTADIERRVSHATKKRDKLERQKAIAEAYDTYLGDYRDWDKIERYNVNYDLFNGRLDMELYSNPVHFKIDNEDIKFDVSSDIVHYPLISQIAKALHGELLNRPFKPIVKQNGPLNSTLVERQWTELLQQYTAENIIRPIEQQIAERFLQQFSPEELLNITPDQQQQIMAQIQSQVQARTPKDIMDFMQNDFVTPTERQAQYLLDQLMVEGDIDYKQSEGFKHAIITGEEVYYIGERYGEPIMEHINLKYFSWGGSQNTEWVQDGTWAKYEQWLTYEDVTQRYAEDLTEEDLKRLEEELEPMGGVKSMRDPKKNPVNNTVMLELSVNENYYRQKYGDYDIRTKDGQKTAISIYDEVLRKYGHQYGYARSSYGIRVAHIVFRDKRKLKRVTRVGADGSEEKFWMDEHYKPVPEDTKVVAVWVDEVWEATLIGTLDPIYVRVRPLPYQYKSINSPFKVELPYYGRRYNTHMNNSENVSIIDAGKSWQMDFDIEMANIKKDLKSNIGNVFVMMLGMKPDNWKWQQWLDVLRDHHLLMIDNHKYGLNNIDPQMLRSINLSKVSDIASRIQLLEFYKDGLTQAMYFNNARIGSIGQYSTNQNIQLTQGASFNQTEDIFETHRIIVEKALNAYLSTARMIYRNNPEKLSFFMDDISRLDMELSPQIWYSEMSVYVKNSLEEVQQIQFLRQQMLAFVQNGMSFDGILELTLAESRNDIVSVLKKETQRADQIRQEQISLAQQQHAEALQSQENIAAAKLQQEAMLTLEKLRSQEFRSAQESSRFAMAADIDNNKIADTLQKELLKLQFEREKLEKELALKEKELEIKEKAANKK